MKATRRNLFILFFSLALIGAVTAGVRWIRYINIPALRILAQVLLNLLNGLIAWAAMKLTGMRLKPDFKNKWQYLIGAGIALVLSLTIAVVPALCGFSLVGSHTDFSWVALVYDFLFYLLVIGPVEEFVFRVYLQDAFVSFFEKKRWLGVVLAAFLFGLWHIINGNLAQALFTFCIGLVFGFAKYKIKACGYAGVAFGHGLYDFFNSLVRMFIL